MTNSKKLHRTCRYYNKPNPRTITDNSELLYCKRCKAIPKNLIETVDYVESKWYEFSKHFELTTWMSCEICWEPLIEKEKWNMRQEGTRNPSTGKGPRIGNTPPPPVKRNLTDKEKLEMLFNYIDVLKNVYDSGIDKRALRQSIVKTFAEIEKILMSDGPSIYWKEELKKLGRSK